MSGVIPQSVNCTPLDVIHGQVPQFMGHPKPVLIQVRVQTAAVWDHPSMGCPIRGHWEVPRFLMDLQ